MATRKTNTSTRNHTIGRRVIYEDGPLWVELDMRVDSLEKGLKDVTATMKQQTNALIGSWDESGTVWRKGMRENLDSLDVKLDENNEATKALKTAAIWLAGFGATAFVSVFIELLNSYFGWFGAAHAAHLLTGGH